MCRKIEYNQGSRMVPSISFVLLRSIAMRLERLSADSKWAHRASGLRGDILKVLDEVDLLVVSPERIQVLIDRGYEILESAAREIPESRKSNEQNY